MPAPHLQRAWCAASAAGAPPRIVVEVDRVASVESAPEHYPRRLPHASSATLQRQAIERAQWLECQRRPRTALRSGHLYALAALLACATVVIYSHGPSDAQAQADTEADVREAIAQAAAAAHAAPR